MKTYTISNAHAGRTVDIDLTDAQAEALYALLGNVVALRAHSPAIMIEEREKAVTHAGFLRDQRANRRPS